MTTTAQREKDESAAVAGAGSSSSGPASTAEIDPTTLALSAIERQEHMVGMDQVRAAMRQRPLRIRAYQYCGCCRCNDSNENDTDTDNTVDDDTTTTVVTSTKIVHFVRHGQGFHNLMADTVARQQQQLQQQQEGGATTRTTTTTWRQFDPTCPVNPYLKPELLDSPLTEKGRLQAVELQKHFVPQVDEGDVGHHDDDGVGSADEMPMARKLPLSPPLPLLPVPDLVVLSPNCRALQTGLLAFEPLLPLLPSQGKTTQREKTSTTNGGDSSIAAAVPAAAVPAAVKAVVPFVAHEWVREETGVHACDMRRSILRQRREFPQVNFDLYDTDDSDNKSGGFTDEDTLFDPLRRETKLQVAERIYKFCDEYLSRLDDCVDGKDGDDVKVVAVVTHSSWLLTFFNGVCEVATATTTCSSCSSSSRISSSSSSTDGAHPLKEWFQTGELRTVKLEFVRTAA